MLLRRRRYLVAAILVVALVGVVIVGGRAAWRLGHRLSGPPPPPRQTDVSAIAGWMSVGYVSRAYRVPAPELHQALGVEPEGRPRSFDEIAKETGRTSDDVLGIVRATVAAWQATHRQPGPDGPPPRPKAPGEAPRSYAP